MNDDSSNIVKLINGFNVYLDKLKQVEEQSLAIFYDYDIEPIPKDSVYIDNEKNKREK